MIRGNFKVNGQDFADWFNDWRLTQGGLFPYALNKENFAKVFYHLRALTGKMNLSLNEFVAVFSFIYNETGGGFYSLKEIGGDAYYASTSGTKVSYSSKEAGRGLNQLTGASNYRYVLGQLGQNYDALNSQQLDELFLQPAVYLAAFRIYLTSPQLVGNIFPLVNQGKFKEFGNAIACGNAYNYACPYGPKFSDRCNALLKALQGKRISNHLLNADNIWLMIAVFVVLAAMAWYFRAQVKSFYVNAYQSVKKFVSEPDK